MLRTDRPFVDCVGMSGYIILASFFAPYFSDPHVECFQFKTCVCLKEKPRGLPKRTSASGSVRSGGLVLLRGVLPACGPNRPREASRDGWLHVAVVVKINGIPFWLVGEFATHFRTYFSGAWDVHWGYGVLTHGHVVRVGTI